MCENFRPFRYYFPPAHLSQSFKWAPYKGKKSMFSKHSHVGYPDLCIEWERKILKSVYNFVNWFLRKVSKTFIISRFPRITYFSRFLGLFSGTSYQNEKRSSYSFFPAQYTSLDTPHDYILRTFFLLLDSDHENFLHPFWTAKIIFSRITKIV